MIPDQYWKKFMEKLSGQKPVEESMGPREENAPILTVTAGEYFYIGNSKDEEFYHLRALKDFEVTEKGISPWDLVDNLEKDGFVEMIPEMQAQDGIDFAWD
jgi:hypothetical protein